MGYGDNVGVWGNSDAKARLLLTDPMGGSATFGPWVDLPGVAEISIKGELSKIEGNGDDETCVDVARTKSFTGKASFGRESISALKLLFGGTSSTSGTTPTQQTDWTDDALKLPRFELQWRPTQDEGTSSDVLRTLHRCQVTSYDLADKFEAATTPSFEFKATRRKSDGKRFSVSVRETGVALVEGAPDSTPATVASSVPIDGAAAVAVAGVVTFTFGTNVDPVFASEIGSYYYAITTTGNAVPFTLAYNPLTYTATLTPTGNLTAATKHVAGVTKNARSVNGFRLATQFAIDFTTA